MQCSVKQKDTQETIAAVAQEIQTACERHRKNIEDVSRAAAARAYEKILGNFNHDMKGTAMQLQEVMTDIEDACGSSAPPGLTTMRHLVNHVAMCLTTMQIRREGAILALRCVSFDLVQTVNNVLHLLPEVRVAARAGERVVMSSDPAAWHSLVHQLCRNSKIHGSGPQEVRILADKLEVSNAPGMNHANLLAAEDVLQACATGDHMGTATSSGQGMGNILFLAEYLKCEFSMRVTATRVVATCTFETRADITTKAASCKPTEAAKGVALLVVDDQKLVRRQAKAFYRDICATRNDPARVVETIAAFDINKEATVVSTSDALIIGKDPPCVYDICAWIRTVISSGLQVVGLFDENLEYDGGLCIRGSDLIAEIKTLTHDLAELILVRHHLGRRRVSFFLNCR
tara:strand:+ start:475 stop:1680 length:1206 start_codon:yes stop_codon:yes gene_type:complete